ncbi:GH25 family lysozyme [Actinokineospora bangkokensis]|uniref:GH25 family lysozyme n=1 Tax=Actinokineospora bangkokensis TaxID=1193682 RepID=UPI0018E9CA10|nr:glycoside hydrolase family 25 protein [Actinokineospora bangkokensis]
MLAGLLTPATATAEDATLTGIDVASFQAGIDFAAVKAAGHSFAIVKAGGSQLAEGPYTTSTYADQVDGARAHGLKVGHYWLSGDFLSPTASADYLVDHLHDYRPGDVIALDDEVLDDSTRLWTDTDAAAFFTRVHDRLAAPYVPWIYLNTTTLRAASWTRTAATGAKLWAASWGPNNGTYPGPPDIGTAYPTWSAHQYTSAGTIAGTPVDLDVAKPSAFTPVEPGPPPPLPKTTTEQDGIPGPVFWQRAQNWLTRDSTYRGPLDGVPGPQTFKALQAELAEHWSYTGPLDGIPGTQTYSAWQRSVVSWGYAGPIDGVMGPNSYRAVARFLNQDAWD